MNIIKSILAEFHHPDWPSAFEWGQAAVVILFLCLLNSILP